MSNIAYIKNDGIVEIVINRPEKKNSLTAKMYGDLNDSFNQAALDNTVQVVNLKGQGGTFTAGNDINDFATTPKNTTSETTNVMKFIKTVSNFEKPIIASVNGMAIGIGVTILMHCDFVYTTRGTTFLLPFVKLGLCPEAASSILLPLNSNGLMSKEKLLLGEPFDADEALKMGIVTAIFDEDKELTNKSNETANKICQLPATSLITTKKLINQTFKDLINKRINEEGKTLFKLLHSQDAKSAFAKFLNS